MKIVFLDTYPVSLGDLSWDSLESLGDFAHYSATPPAVVVERCRGAAVVITNKCKITAEVMAQLPDLRCICVAATGYDNIDLDAARSHDIKVRNVAGYSTQSVVQQVFALLLSVINEPQRYAQGVRAGRWARSQYFAYSDQPIRSLEAMTMGILGFGTIGQAVAHVALAIGMQVIAHRRSDTASPIAGVEMVSREDLLSRSDVVSLHAPATPDTQGMVDAGFLSSLKDDCILINTARGSLVVEQDLANWLSGHPRAFALLDVLGSEPPAISHPLYGLTNCLITPHQAWMGSASRQKLLDSLVTNIKNYHAGTLKSLT